MTSSTKEILAIATLDGKPVGTGKPGPLRRTDVAVVPGFQEHRNAQRLTWLPAKDTLLEFPCDFPLKIMGKAHDELARRCSPSSPATPLISTAQRWKCAPVPAATI